MSGFFRPAAAKMSITSSETMAFETIWRIAWSSSSSVLRSPGAPLASTARTAWKKPTSSRIRERLRRAARRARTPSTGP